MTMRRKKAAAPESPRASGAPVTALERESHVALYMQIAEHLKNEIAAGAYATTGRLPPEPSLTKRFGVSRVTVRLAIGHLINEGMVVRKQGKGTFVAGSLVRHDLRELKGIIHALDAQGLSPQTELLTFEPDRPPPEVADALRSGERRRVLLRRLYRLDGNPIALATTWLPLEARRVTWEEAERYPSYTIIQRLLGMPIARAQIAIRGRLAGREYGRVLEVGARSPVLVLERLSSDAEGRPLEFTRFAVNSETYEFTLSADGPFPIGAGIKLAAAGT